MAKSGPLTLQRREAFPGRGLRDGGDRLSQAAEEFGQLEPQFAYSGIPVCLDAALERARASEKGGAREGGGEERKRRKSAHFLK